MSAIQWLKLPRILSCHWLNPESSPSRCSLGRTHPTTCCSASSEQTQWYPELLVKWLCQCTRWHHGCSGCWWCNWILPLPWQKTTKWPCSKKSKVIPWRTVTPNCFLLFLLLMTSCLCKWGRVMLIEIKVKSMLNTSTRALQYSPSQWTTENETR